MPRISFAVHRVSGAPSLNVRFPARSLLAAWLLTAFGAVGTIDRAAAQGAPPDSSSIRPHRDEREAVRGIERDRREGGQVLKTTGNAILFLPRTLVSGFLYATVYCGQFIDDRHVVST